MTLNTELLFNKNPAAGGYTIDRSLRFNSADSAYLSRTPASAGDRKTWTWAGWVKRSKLGTEQAIFCGGTGTTDTTLGQIIFGNNDTIRINGYSTTWRETSQVFRDASAWYHLVVAFDTTQSTASNRVKLYVNGTQVTQFAQSNDPSQNVDYAINQAAEHDLGKRAVVVVYSDFYLADVHFIDGQALDPTSFGEFDTNGVWQPIEYTGSYNNGTFYSNYLTGGIDPNYPAVNGFDGITTGVGVRTTGNGTMIWEMPTPVTYSSSFKIYCSLDGTSWGNTFTVTHAGGTTDFTSSVATGTTNTAVDLAQISGVTSPITKITISSGGSNPRFSAIEVDGNILTDATVGRNSFHLDFADNSSAAALGYDAAGSNDWTVNNFSVSAGNDSIINLLSPSDVNSSYPFARVFDSSLSTGAFVGGGNPRINTYTFSSSVSASTLDLYVSYPHDGNHTLTFQVNGSTVSPTSTTSSVATGGEAGDVDKFTFSVSGGSLTSFRITDTVGFGNAQFSLTAIALNGTILIYGSENDSLRDSPTNGDTANDTGLGNEVPGNYCTLNPLQYGGSVNAPTNGNLDITSASAGYGGILGTFGMSSGKWYFEFTPSSTSSALGIAKPNTPVTSYLGQYSGAYIYLSNGNKANNNSYTSYGNSFTSGDVIGVAFDADNGTLTFYKNGTSQGSAYTGLTSGPYLPAFSDDFGSAACDGSFNFGSRPFAYPVSGFKALCTTNLPTPTIADGSTAMDVKLYTGNGSSQSISGLGFSPDLVWVKQRSGSSTAHSLEDIIRGTSKHLASNATDAEVDVSVYGGGVTAFNSAGFSVGSWGAVNENTQSYVSWLWDAGSSTVSNTQGSITSSVRANASAGFSIVSFTAQSSGSATVGHGLGVAPSLIITKSRTQNLGWYIYTKTVGSSGWLQFTTAAAVTGNTAAFGGVDPTSTVFTYGSGLTNTGDIVAYCFAPVAGYSSFGSYTGNGSSDGPFVYTGHRSRWIMIKRTDSAGNWGIYDTARDPENVEELTLLADTSGSESTDANKIDIISNGFKARASNANINASGGTYIFASFASHPFQTARAR